MALPETIRNLIRNRAAEKAAAPTMPAAPAKHDADASLVEMAKRVAAAREPNGKCSATEHLPVIGAGEDPNAALVRFAQALQAKRRQ